MDRCFFPPKIPVYPHQNQAITPYSPHQNHGARYCPFYGFEVLSQAGHPFLLLPRRCQSSFSLAQRFFCERPGSQNLRVTCNVETCWNYKKRFEPRNWAVEHDGCGNLQHLEMGCCNLWWLLGMVYGIDGNMDPINIPHWCWTFCSDSMVIYWDFKMWFNGLWMGYSMI